MEFPETMAMGIPSTDLLLGFGEQCSKWKQEKVEFQNGMTQTEFKAYYMRDSLVVQWPRISFLAAGLTLDLPSYGATMLASAEIIPMFPTGWKTC